jgi:hypothetical protein
MSNNQDENFTIAIVWSVGDVQVLRPDLTVLQCIEVLQRVKRQHDAEHGISWDTLENVAENLFPKE